MSNTPNSIAEIKLETVSSIQKKFIIRVPADEITKRVEKKFIEVQKTAKIKGFRPGKVPMNMVKQFYASDVKDRVLQNVVDESYYDALRAHSLRIVGQPVIKPIQADEHGDHLHIHDGEDLSFQALVDVIPDVEVKDYKGLSLEKESEEVTDEDFAQVRKSYLERRATLAPVERAAKSGDIIDYKYTGQLKTDSGWEDRADLSGERVIEIGSGQLLPDFEKNLVGLKSGGTTSFEFTYPKDYKESVLAGQTALYNVDVREVKEKNIPEMSEDLAKEMGFEGLEDFNAKIREYLGETKKEETASKLRNDLIEKLIEKNTFEVPNSLVMAQMRSIAEDYSQELRRYGFNDQMIQTALMNELESFKKRAESQVRGGIILDAIAKKENVTAKPEDLEVEMAKAAPSYGISMQEFKQRLDSNPREKSNFEFRVKEELTIQLILAAAKVKTKKA